MASHEILLAKLLQSTPSRRPEAEALLREAISLSRGRKICGPSKELAELLIHCGEDAAGQRGSPIRAEVQ